MNNTEALKPCPFCGAGLTSLRENGKMWTGQRYSEPTSVSVQHFCEPVAGQPSRMIERVGRDEASAIEAWNRRAALAQQPAASGEPVAWRDHVEERIRGWRQRTMNRSGDRLALDDMMGQDSIEDLIDYVCDEWAEPAAAQPAPARVPPGWQLVPVEPTPEMLEAVKPFPHHLTAEHPDPADPWHRQMAAAVRVDQMCAASEYRQMLAAAPTPQEPTRAEGE